jgi:hypothetical protein
VGNQAATTYEVRCFGTLEDYRSCPLVETSYHPVETLGLAEEMPYRQGSEKSDPALPGLGWPNQESRGPAWPNQASQDRAWLDPELPSQAYRPNPSTELD